jgi:hypothetical protein
VAVRVLYGVQIAQTPSSKSTDIALVSQVKKERRFTSHDKETKKERRLQEPPIDKIRHLAAAMDHAGALLSAFLLAPPSPSPCPAKYPTILIGAAPPRRSYELMQRGGLAS